MHRGLGGTAFEPLEEGRDREITLGPTMLAVLGLGLFALCSLCFLGGYAMGHSGQVQTAAPPSPSGPTAADLLREEPKPAATASTATPQPATQPAPDSQTAAADPGAASAVPAVQSTAVVPAAQSSSTTSTPSVVHTALPGQPTGAESAPSNGQVQPALQQGSWMVQIAAVSHPEDANVLMGALRQRGYAVSTRRDPIDNLIHVQVGPFATHADAASMRQRLLNDGYNALIQP